MANYEVLEPGGHAALVDGLKDYADREGGTDTEQLADGSVEMDKLGDDVLDELDSKAYADGYYAQLTAGAADNLTGRGDATTAEFLYRTAGGTADIETGQAVAKSVKGNTIRWNQLVRVTNQTDTLSGVTFVSQANDGTITANGEATENANRGLSVNVLANHKYLYHGCPVGGSLDSYASVLTGSSSVIPYNNWDYGSGNMVTAREDGSATFIIARIAAGYNAANLVFHPKLFDLTVMFGAGNEPSTVAEFEALFPLPYYEYDAGSLLSVNMTGIETVGFNQWDEEWELGTISTTTGLNVPSTTNIRAKNLCKCFPDTSYYFKNPASGSVFLYDANGDFVKMVVFDNTSGLFTTTSDTHYFRFAMGSSYGTTYNHDICINLSWSGRRNGEYESYWSAQRLIDVATYFPDGMRSAGTVHDELTSTEAITRVGVVDLGTLTWTYSNAFFRTSDLNSVILRPASNYTAADAKCSKYEVGAWNSELDKSVMVGKDADNPLLVKDTDYTDAAAFKTAMSGVMLYYALATPVVTPIDPPLNLSYRVDDFGTERVMVPEDERSAPPVLDIAYGLNVVDFVRRAPTEYISHASMSQFRLALMAHLGVFINETWDEVDNRYKYTITSE